MSLNSDQLTQLKAHIEANTDQSVIDALASGNHSEIANLYNALTDQDAWRSSIDPIEYKEALVWTEVDSLSVGNARIWEWVTANMTQDIDASKSNVRQGIADAFTGTSTLAALNGIAKRKATVYENVFASGGATKTLEVEGLVDHRIIGKALSS